MQRQVSLERVALFSTTRWTLILSCRDENVSTDSALNELCTIYWRPVHAVICRRGYSINDAQDLTQQFFVNVVTRQLVKKATTDRGRFRTFMMSALRNFLADAHAKRTAVRRGGAATLIPLDDWIAETTAQATASPAVASWPDERVFDWRWAATAASRALSRLAEECDTEAARWIFEGLKPYLGIVTEQPACSELAAQLGVPMSLIRRLLHKFRRRFAALLRNEIADTIGNPAEIDDEMRYLCSVLGSL
jgi:DNA-directed RNA polymerase specialized sigma24 family protein